MKRIQQQILRNIFYVNMFILTLCLLVSCNEDVTIKQDFEYSIRMQKYRTDVKIGVPTNLVFFLDNTGDYSDIHYHMSYFLRKGNGMLRGEDNTVLIDNTLYDIQGDTLRINYTPNEKGEHVLEFEFKDNFNQIRERTIQLSAD